MKGVLVAAGFGTHPDPPLAIASEQLLPVYDRPLVCGSIEKRIEGAARP